MKLAAIAGGVVLGATAARNMPPMPHTSLTLCVVVILALMLLAYLGGKQQGSSSAEASAEASAVAEAQARSRAASASQAGGGQSTSAVNVLVVPPGADPAQLAAALGTTAYQVEAPADVLPVVPPQSVPVFRAPLEQGTQS